MKKDNKNPWIAGILNFLIPGLGYLYIGKRVNFGIIVLISEIFMIMFFIASGFVGTMCDLVSISAQYPCLRSLDYFGNIFFMPSLLIMELAFAYDEYTIVKEKS